MSIDLSLHRVKHIRISPVEYVKRDDGSDEYSILRMSVLDSSGEEHTLRLFGYSATELPVSNGNKT